MPHPIIKSLGAVFLSLILAFGLIVGVEGLSSILHPWPEDFSGTPEEIILQVQNYPTWVLAFLGGIGWGTTMLFSTFIATRFGHNRNPLHGYSVGLLLVSMAVFNMILLPYPVWFWILSLMVLPAAAFFGTNWARMI